MRGLVTVFLMDACRWDPETLFRLNPEVNISSFKDWDYETMVKFNNKSDEWYTRKFREEEAYHYTKRCRSDTDSADGCTLFSRSVLTQY